MADTEITLRGMTWSHPRGYDPLVACSAAWKEKTAVSIVWDQRSLQDFETFPVEVLARDYDLIVIDHPHVGQVTAEGCLAPLDVARKDAERQMIAADPVGQSYVSYVWQDRLWALPIDAATQVQAWRSDLLAEPVRRWEDVLRLADQGRVALPMQPPHSLMSLFTLSGQLGRPGTVEGPDLLDREAAVTAYDMLADLTGRIGDAAFSMDPIRVLDSMSEEASPIACAPLIYGYVSYALEAFRPRRIGFADLVAIDDDGLVSGSALGGTGMAVSRFSPHLDAAIDFAYWVAGGEVQSGLYAASGGQPGHGFAWADPGVNAAVSDFYRATRPTLEGAWLRPRHDGYMAFQHEASVALNAALRSGADGRATIDALNRMFADTLPK